MRQTTLTKIIALHSNKNTSSHKSACLGALRHKNALIHAVGSKDGIGPEDVFHVNNICTKLFNAVGGDKEKYQEHTKTAASLINSYGIGKLSPKNNPQAMISYILKHGPIEIINSAEHGPVMTMETYSEMANSLFYENTSSIPMAFSTPSHFPIFARLILNLLEKQFPGESWNVGVFADGSGEFSKFLMDFGEEKISRLDLFERSPELCKVQKDAHEGNPKVFAHKIEDLTALQDPNGESKSAEIGNKQKRKLNAAIYNELLDDLAHHALGVDETGVLKVGCIDLKGKEVLIPISELPKANNLHEYLKIPEVKKIIQSKIDGALEPEKFYVCPKRRIVEKNISSYVQKGGIVIWSDYFCKTDFATSMRRYGPHITENEESVYFETTDIILGAENVTFDIPIPQTTATQIPTRIGDLATLHDAYELISGEFEEAYYAIKDAIAGGAMAEEKSGAAVKHHESIAEKKLVKLIKMYTDKPNAKALLDDFNISKRSMSFNQAVKSSLSKVRSLFPRLLHSRDWEGIELAQMLVLSFV